MGLCAAAEAPAEAPAPAGERYVCDICGYVYDPAQGDPEHGVAPGTAWADVPADYRCPLCRMPKEKFSKAE
ncbi:MAG: rubredoxin [Clostridia bacterium]|nr:rubredoxin [Clostridia bacterium]